MKYFCNAKEALRSLEHMWVRIWPLVEL
jgi:hypothetical protein